VRGHWVDVEAAPYETDVRHCRSCGAMTAGRYWQTEDDDGGAFCSPECAALEVRVRALRERYGDGAGFPSRANGATATGEPAPVEVPVAELKRWTADVLAGAGASAEAAEVTARCLVDASQRGVDTHGVILLSLYLPRLRSGAIDGDARPESVVDRDAIALVDGHHALGAYVSTFAMELCCSKAERAGAAVVAVRNSSHFGAASCFAELAARRGCIGIALSNSDPGMAPLGGLRPVLGTNPLAIAGPGAGEKTPSLDIATSTAAVGRVKLAARRGERVPADWAIGPDGRSTDDPELALRGAMLPLGGHKGFGLAFMIDVLTACLPAAAISPSVEGDARSPRPQRLGHCFVAVSVEAFRDLDGYGESLRELAAAVRTAPHAPFTGPFMIPGEREAAVAAERAETIPLDESTAAILRSLGAEFGVPFPR
jgi:LDH2 family malate/lactate/ureidoglycolate dehydrogenase